MSKVVIDYDKMLVTVYKPAVEKYARKLAQDALKADGNYGCTVFRYYRDENGKDVFSEKEDRWVFELWSPYLTLKKAFGGI